VYRAAGRPGQPRILALTFGVDAAALAKRPYWIHPALTEVVQNALLQLALGADPSGYVQLSTATRGSPAA
jgi:hypothetical protein